MFLDFPIDGGLSYTYCDTNGSGSDFLIYGNVFPELEFSVNKLGVSEVTNETKLSPVLTTGRSWVSCHP